MKFLAGLLVLLAFVASSDAICDSTECVACADESGCSWNVDEGACRVDPTGGLGTDVWATTEAECGTRTACVDKVGCEACTGHNWDTADATMLCQFDLETSECQKSFGADVLSSDPIISDSANCNLVACSSFTDCQMCTDNNVKQVGETEDHFCQWDPSGDGKCDTDGKTDIGPRISHGENCAADNEDCDTYTSCETCVIDIGTVGCEWNVNDNECKTKIPGSTGAKNVEECSFKEQDCALYESCETCVTDLGSTGCEWDVNENKCSLQIPGSSGAKEVAECSAGNMDCAAYTDCKGCVTDLGSNGCQWDVNEKKCETKVPQSGTAKSEGQCEYKNQDCELYESCETCVTDLGVIGCQWDMDELVCEGRNPLTSGATDQEECNSSSALTAGFAIVGAAAALLL